MTPHRLLCCRFLFTFFGLDCAQNRIFFFCTEEHFGYLIHAQYQCTSSKQKIVYRCGSSNINPSIFVCSVDVCRASKPFPYINLVPNYQELEQTSIKKKYLFQQIISQGGLFLCRQLFLSEEVKPKEICFPLLPGQKIRGRYNL